ncbi:MAG TPA: DUF3048 domain-containing protein, partial [Candidatus Methylomirabilis sp.]|nr:DUF3048 domain-containing protein [Candidatus Methylomirabilis sp.]
MIFSIVLFLSAIFFLSWLILSPRPTKQPLINTPPVSLVDHAKTANSCASCIRRLIDGVYVKPDDFNPPLAAVMIDNHPDARPPAGLEKASLVYEAEVEGYYTRLMAVYHSSSSVEKIGPVRSARPYFLDWASELNAIYVHCGGSPEALVKIVQSNITDLNEFYNGQYFWRATNRSAPHNIYISSQNLNNFLQSDKIFSSDLTSWKFKDDAPAVEATSSAIKINYRAPEFAVVWTYRRSSNDYLRSQNNQPVKTEDNQLITAKNLIIQIVPAKVIDAVLRLKMNDVGSGQATICLDGTCRAGEWQKTSATARTKFSYSDGQEVKFNAGPTWIEVVRPE